MYFTQKEYKVLNGFINEVYKQYKRNDEISTLCIHLAIKVFKLYKGKTYVLSEKELDNAVKMAVNSGREESYVEGVADFIDWIKEKE